MIAMIDIDLSQYMTFDEAAQHLALTVGSVRTMVSKGMIEGRKSPFGGTMVSRSSVESYCSRRKKTGRPPKSSK